MQPRQIRETLTPVEPRLIYSIVALALRFSAGYASGVVLNDAQNSLAFTCYPSNRRQASFPRVVLFQLLIVRGSVVFESGLILRKLAKTLVRAHIKPVLHLLQCFAFGTQALDLVAQINQIVAETLHLSLGR